MPGKDDGLVVVVIGAVTIKVAEAMGCEAVAGIVLSKLPTSGPVTFTDNVQEPPPGIVRPAAIVTEELPAVAVSVPVPPQVVATPGVPVITKLPGRKSVNASRAASSGSLLEKVIVRVEGLFCTMEDGLKDLESS